MMFDELFVEYIIDIIQAPYEEKIVRHDIDMMIECANYVKENYDYAAKKYML